ESFYREALEGRRRAFGAEHPDTLISVINMAHLSNVRGRFDEARAALEENHPLIQRVFGLDHWRCAEARSLVGEALVGLGRLEAAEHYLLESFTNLEGSLPEGRRKAKLPLARERIVKLYEAWDKTKEAGEWRDGAVEGD
ncbi:MAG: tetratricopeptide repeat protein, partial [Myxococcota bacterium]